METAGADEIPDEAERKGLGTPATRAATIEKLVQRGFLERFGDKKTRHLVATEKGNSFAWYLLALESIHAGDRDYGLRPGAKLRKIERFGSAGEEEGKVPWQKTRIG